MHDTSFLTAKQSLASTFLAETAALGTLRALAGDALTEAEARRNVHAVGIGRKIVNGVTTDLKAVRIYVSHKRPDAEVPERYRIPRELNGVPTDVIESAPATFASCAQALKAHRPVIGGISGGHFGVASGTIGCRCRSTKPEDKDIGANFVLSCHHVFTTVGVTAKEGEELFQPSRGDAGPGEQVPFATLVRNIPLQPKSNEVDAAIGLLKVQMLPEICSIGAILGTESATEHMRVMKHGRTTGLTLGMIDDDSIDHIVELDSGTNLEFVNQLRIVPLDQNHPFAENGDSGAIVLDHESRAVGLLFAKGTRNERTYAVANRIERVQARLEIALLE